MGFGVVRHLDPAVGRTQRRAACLEDDGARDAPVAVLREEVHRHQDALRRRRVEERPAQLDLHKTREVRK